MEIKLVDELISEIRKDIDSRTREFIIMSKGEKLFGKYKFDILFKNGKAEIIRLRDGNLEQTFGLK